MIMSIKVQISSFVTTMSTQQEEKLNMLEAYVIVLISCESQHLIQW
jgi:hypothetical protein